MKISAVSYLNTFPFVFGMMKSGHLKNFSLELDVPSVCAEKLKNGSVDIALVPAGALPEINQYHFISDFCIGAAGEVRTVLLLSKVPLERIRKVHLDFDSRTSVELVKILASHYWKITPEWENMQSGQAGSMYGYESLVAIGDKTFTMRPDFPYAYDLAGAWTGYTGMPFVFAAWVSRDKLPDDIIRRFSLAISWGVGHKRESIEYFRDRLPAYDHCLRYLEENISYDFDAAKMRGLELFLSHLR